MLSPASPLFREARYLLADEPELLALSVFVDKPTAELARAAWYGLSRAMHHHTYELSATAAELEGWLNDTEAVLERLSRGVPVRSAG